MIGLDSSHLFLLARACRGDRAGPDQLYDLVAAHSCGGGRRVVTTTTCLELECFGVVGQSSTGLTGFCPGIAYDDLAAIIEVLKDDGFEDQLPTTVLVQGRLVSFDRGERSLSHVLRDEKDAIIVLFDEDAFDAIRELVETNVIGAYPVTSLELVRAMYDCGVLSYAEARAICLAADEAIQSLPGMARHKAQRKKRDVAELINHVELSEARRAEASGHDAWQRSPGEEAR